MSHEQYVAEIEVLRPIIAGLSKEYFDFRVFRRGGSQIIIYKYDMEKNKEIIEKLKKENPAFESVKDYHNLKKMLRKIGYIDMDYIFPRVMSNPYAIDWHKYLVRPIYFILTKAGKYSGVKIIDIIVKDEDVTIGTYYTYVNSTGAPVVYETIEIGSKFRVVFESDGMGDKEIRAKIGRMRRYGFGWVKVKVTKLTNSK